MRSRPSGNTNRIGPISAALLSGALGLAYATPTAFAQSDTAGGNKSPGDVREEKAEGETPNDEDDAPEPTGKPVPTIDVVRAGLEPSYIAYPLGLSGLDKLIFESNVVAHFVMHLPDWPVAFVLTPKVLVRMFYEDSAPVKSPSYMPRVAAYFWFQREVERDTPTFYGSLTLSHHSNGQTQSFFDDAGNVRHDGGDFSTNYLVPWTSDFSHISARDRRRSHGARPPEYSMYFKVAQRSERRRDCVEICGESLVQGTRGESLHDRPIGPLVWLERAVSPVAPRLQPEP